MRSRILVVCSVFALAFAGVAFAKDKPSKSGEKGGHGGSRVERHDPGHGAHIVPRPPHKPRYRQPYPHSNPKYYRYGEHRWEKNRRYYFPRHYPRPYRYYTRYYSGGEAFAPHFRGWHAEAGVWFYWPYLYPPRLGCRVYTLPTVQILEYDDDGCEVYVYSHPVDLEICTSRNRLGW